MSLAASALSMMAIIITGVAGTSVAADASADRVLLRASRQGGRDVRKMDRRSEVARFRLGWIMKELIRWFLPCSSSSS